MGLFGICKRLIGKSQTTLQDDHSCPSYSQEGEDLVLRRMFDGNNNGFFVDIGAHDPKRFSNTYLLYLKGWRGINIDPLPGTKQRFDQERPEDINLEIGISEYERDLTYHMFNEPALNTFDEKEAKTKDGIHNGQFYITEKKTVKTYPLATIFKKYVPQDQKIDVLTIDVEGLDLKVLKSNDWSLYRPELLLVEELNSNIESILTKSEVYAFLKQTGYQLIARTVNTSFYKKSI